MSLTSKKDDTAKEKSKADLLRQLSDKNKKEQEQCLQKIKAALAEHGCDISITCVIDGQGTRLMWGLRSK